MPFRIDDSIRGSAAIVCIHGDVDSATAPALRAHLDQVLDGGASNVVVNLLGVDFMDSSGLGALVSARNHAGRTSATVELVCASSSTLRMLRITGLDRVFVVHRTEADMLAAHNA